MAAFALALCHCSLIPVIEVIGDFLTEINVHLRHRHQRSE
jgi:hypothetical protein